MARSATFAEDATALCGRGAEWLFHCYASWTDTDDARHIAWARATEEALRPWTMAGMALNFVSDIDNDRVRSDVRGREVRPAGAAEAPLGSGERLLDEPEHSARKLIEN